MARFIELDIRHKIIQAPKIPQADVVDIRFAKRCYGDIGLLQVGFALCGAIDNDFFDALRVEGSSFSLGTRTYGLGKRRG